MKKGLNTPKNSPRANDFTRLMDGIAALYDSPTDAARLLQEKIGAIRGLKKYRPLRATLAQDLEKFYADQQQMAERRKRSGEKSPVAILKVHVDEWMAKLEAASKADEIGITREAFEQKYNELVLGSAGPVNGDESLDDVVDEALHDPETRRAFFENEEELVGQLSRETEDAERYGKSSQMDMPDMETDSDVHESAEAFAMAMMAEEAKLAQRAKTG
ncbi:MAG TPA: hypothetical protein VI588_04960 [Candidatus Gracilibacteria bacterium]|nr:hypothetical protein [Candidatus Gracilibacteria bacterium]